MRLSDIRARLAAHPQGLVAFVREDGEIRKTFAELAVDVSALSARLAEAGLGPGSRVGILGRNSYAWMVWDLALLELNLISVGLPEEFASIGAPDIIRRYGLGLLAADVPTLWGQPAVCELTHIVERLPSRASEWNPFVKSGPEDQPRDVASMVFSSGTTGRLKGLYISRTRVERVVEEYSEAFPPAPADRHLIFIPFTNFQQRLTYYGCLYHGVDVIVVPMQRLFPALAEFHPTFLIGPPMLYETLRSVADQGAGVDATSRRLAAILGGKIRYLITGMAPIKRRTLEFYALHGVPIYEAYGCTEAGMIAWNRPGATKLGTVGRPIRPDSVQLSAEGEVLVVNDSPVALGYFDVPAHEAEQVFISPTTVATGDIGSFDEDGFLRLDGRLRDAIVLADGRKFHPESIEAMLEAHGEVLTAVVFARKEQGLVALIQVQSGKAEAMRRSVNEHVAQVNESLDPLRKITDVRLTDETFTPENGLRTANFKLSRRAIRQHLGL